MKGALAALGGSGVTCMDAGLCPRILGAGVVVGVDALGGGVVVGGGSVAALGAGVVVGVAALGAGVVVGVAALGAGVVVLKAATRSIWLAVACAMVICSAVGRVPSASLGLRTVVLRKSVPVARSAFVSM